MDNLNIKNLILRDRESRVNFIKTFLKKHNVICLKANIVGEHKNTNYSYVVTKYFEKKIDDFKYTRYWEIRLNKEEKAQAVKEVRDKRDVAGRCRLMNSRPLFCLFCPF